MAKSGKKRLIKFWKYYEQWYETYKVNSVRGVTAAKYKLVLKWLKKLAPDLTLGDMTRGDFQKLINDYGKTHQKATVTDFYHHVAPAVDDAAYEGWIDGKNPNHKIKITSMVRAGNNGPKYLEMDEVKKLEKVFKEDKIGWGDFFDFSLRTGTRFAEALGITPEDVDVDNMTVYINKTFNYKSEKYGSDKYGEFMPTKNKYSVRMIKIDYKTLMDLQRHMDGVAPDKPIWAHWYASFGRVSSVYGEPRIFNSTFNKKLEEMCWKAGVHRVTVHGLRHTHASILIANRVSIQSVAKRLGHGDTETTQRVYIHLLDELAQEDDNKIMTVMAGI
ncbi:site-specific integrase [Lactobacillaceae bacterium 24-114]